MRLEFLSTKRSSPESSGDRGWDIGAAVVRGNPGGGVVLELGPADGPPHLRLSLTVEEALRLSSSVHVVTQSGGEQIILGE